MNKMLIRNRKINQNKMLNIGFFSYIASTQLFLKVLAYDPTTQIHP